MILINSAALRVRNRKTSATARRILAMEDTRRRRYFQECLACWYADRRGYKSDKGGWIKTGNGYPLAQGWLTFYFKFRLKIIHTFWEVHI